MLNKWFAIQAQADLPTVLEQIQDLTTHEKFFIDNPNCVYSLIYPFILHNMTHFHDEQGKGYTFLADFIIKIDQINPMVSARLVKPLTHWARHTPQRSQLMKQELSRIFEQKLSPNLYECIEKSLSDSI